jgi:acetoin utilization deacetylase AcuC-like enzyme
MATGLVWHELYAWHDTGTGSGFMPAGGLIEPEQHGESPATKRRLRNLLEVTGLLGRLEQLEPRAATDEELLRLHTRAYLQRIKAASADGGGDAGEFAPFGPGGFEIAALSAGGVLVAVDAVLRGTVADAYALVRPPGHHAERDLGKGFCLFGNVALAALHARAVHGLERIAVIDWDVHHGNGTEHAFYDDAGVLTISLHQDNLYPVGTGALADVGEGAGHGFNINVPLPPGAAIGAYAATFERVVLPALARYRPELIVVACGFDASALDPLGRMMLTSADFATLARLVKQAAGELCEGRLVLCHEGGYSTTYVPFCGAAVIEELIGAEERIGDPYDESYRDAGYRELQPQQDAVVAAAERLLDGLGGPRRRGGRDHGRDA